MPYLLSATLLLTTLLAAPAVRGPQAAAGTDVTSIRNFLRVNTDFCTGGQPRPEHFQALKAAGVKSVLNLRTPGEHRADEEVAAVKAAGLAYFGVPVVYTAPTSESVDEFLRITDDPANRPVFIHCTAAIRVGAFWLIRRVVRDDWTWDAALEEARRVGLVQAPHLETLQRSTSPRRSGRSGRGPANLTSV